MKIYELRPIDGRASFYGKARVIIDENSVETLVSYNTPIMRRLPDGKLEKLWDGWTQTTSRHIKAFCGMDKKQYQALQKAV